MTTIEVDIDTNSINIDQFHHIDRLAWYRANIPNEPARKHNK